MSYLEHPSQAERKRRWWILLILSVALFMIMLDVTIVSIALPHIMDAFHTTMSSIEWVINIYVLVFAALMITAGKLGDIYGRKLLFLSGLGIFTIASLICGLSPSVNILIATRALQAIGGAAMMPATLSILNVVFGEENKGMALGIWAAVAGAAAALGPIIGGLLIDAYSWRLIFLINLPVGIAAFLAAFFIVGESADSTVSRRIDIPGVVFATVALLCLTYALVEGQKYGWTSSLIIGLFVASFVCAAIFVFIERRHPQPLVQLQLFRNVTFSAGNSVQLILMFGLMSVLFQLVLFLQLVLGFSATKTGLAVLPMPLVIIIVGPLSGRLSDKVGSRWMIFSGMLLTALGIYLMSHLSLDTGWPDLILPLAVCGLGMGLAMPPMTSAVITNAPQENSGVASGILTTMRNIGAVLGISAIGAVLQNQLVKNLQEALNQIPQLPSFIRDRILAEISSGNLRMGATMPALPGPIGDQLLLLFQEQFAHSLNTAMMVSVFVCLAGAIVALFVRNHVSTK